MNNIINNDTIINTASTNINYIIEGNYDFKKEMANNNDNGSNNNSINELCLVSQEPLTKSHIKLPCDHRFNYMALYNEVSKQKQKNLYQTYTLKLNQMKCPYCRVVFDKFLPYIPSECAERTNGVNYPFKYGMENIVKCEWQKKNESTMCGKVALYIDSHSYCKIHYLKSKKLIKHLEPVKDKLMIPSQSIYINKTISELKVILKQHHLTVTGKKSELIERILNKIVDTT